LKTLQLKKEIDSISDRNNEACSSEESYSHERDLTPRSREKIKVERKLRKKLTRVMETFVDRMDNSSASHGSGDEMQGKCQNKKRKYQEYLNGLKKYSASGHKVLIHSSKKRLVNEI